MDEDEFLIRLKIVNIVATAGKLNAEGLHFKKKSGKAAIDKTAGTAKADFVSEVMKYIQYLLGEVLRQTGFRSDIV